MKRWLLKGSFVPSRAVGAQAARCQPHVHGAVAALHGWAESSNIYGPAGATAPLLVINS